MQEKFIEILMDTIMEATMIPKAQVERAVGPILSMFLAEVLTETLASDPHLSGALDMVCPEFPLKKAHNRQSTNIDWLMLNKARGMLLFVELKTSDTSVNPEQNAIYHKRIHQVKEQGGGFLVQDVEALRDASNEFGKYQYILEDRISPFRDHISACRAASLVYLVPESARARVEGHADRILTFSELSGTIPGEFSQAWAVIHNRLSLLDQISRSSRNKRSPSAQSTPTGSSSLIGNNFTGKLRLPEMMELCRTRGDAIVVGFSGGRVTLENTSLEFLEQRLYKWDEVRKGTGSKNPHNWIPGKTFSWVMERKAVRQEQNNQIQHNNQTNRSVNWSGTCKFSEMVQLCKQHGDSILIGFTGGTAAFSNASLEQLHNRQHYKWDWSSSTAKRNRNDWLPGGMVLLLLEKHHGIK